MAHADSIRINMIAAMAQNHVIGDGEKMPWHIPEDLKLFKKLTSGKPVVMGRKTYESIGRPLPNRDNIVITRDPSWHEEGVIICHDIDAALEIAAQKAKENQGDEIMVIGGGTIYQQVLPRAHRIYLTRIMKNFIGNARFPEWDEREWTLTERSELATENMYDFEIFFEQHDRAKCV